MDELISRAAFHIERHFIPGSDPGLCIVPDDGQLALSSLIRFGRLCTQNIVTREDAILAASGVHLSGHGGSDDGMIGAAAAVGLTAYGWAGRFIEFGRLRDFPEQVRVGDLEESGIIVVSIGREAELPVPKDLVDTKGWLRPRLWSGRPVLPVISRGRNCWETVEERKQTRRKKGEE
jgi:hypothetical protein